MVYELGCMALNVRVTGNDKLVKMGKEEAIAYFKLLFQN
jgi:hypothetical protein